MITAVPFYSQNPLPVGISPGANPTQSGPPQQQENAPYYQGPQRGSPPQMSPGQGGSMQQPYQGSAPSQPYASPPAQNQGSPNPNLQAQNMYNRFSPQAPASNHNMPRPQQPQPQRPPPMQQQVPAQPSQGLGSKMSGLWKGSSSGKKFMMGGAGLLAGVVGVKALDNAWGSGSKSGSTNGNSGGGNSGNGAYGGAANTGSYGTGYTDTYTSQPEAYNSNGAAGGGYNTAYTDSYAAQPATYDNSGAGAGSGADDGSFNTAYADNYASPSGTYDNSDSSNGYDTGYTNTDASNGYDTGYTDTEANQYE
jgi:hypothetical protein